MKSGYRIRGANVCSITAVLWRGRELVVADEEKMQGKWGARADKKEKESGGVRTSVKSVACMRESMNEDE